MVQFLQNVLKRIRGAFITASSMLISAVFALTSPVSCFLMERSPRFVRFQRWVTSNGYTNLLITLVSMLMCVFVAKTVFTLLVLPSIAAGALWLAGLYAVGLFLQLYVINVVIGGIAMGVFMPSSYKVSV